MKPPARAMVGHIVWSNDGGVWAVWSVKPFPHAHTSPGDKLSVHSRLRSLLVSLPSDSMLLSISEKLDPFDVVDQMADGIDLERQHAWRDICEGSAEWLSQIPMRRRLYYLAAALPSGRRPFLESLRDAADDVGLSFGITRPPVAGADVVLRRRQARELEVRLAQHVTLRPVTAGELCWLYARSLRREVDEPAFDDAWEPPSPAAASGVPDGRDDAERWRPRGVLAHLTDAVVTEGGSPDDEDRPRHRRYVRIDGPGGTSYQTALALADMPHYFRFPGGGGEWLYHADHAGFPLDWCVRVRAVKNADAQSKVRRKHRDLVGQVGEYDGDMTGAPPQLAEAIQSIDEERAQLGANPAEPELQTAILFSIAAGSLEELEARASSLAAMFEPQEYGLARPTGGQAALLRSMLPGAPAAAVCRDYTQFMLARDLAAGTPFCGSDVGDPTGLLLGMSLDGGTSTPVLFDPAFGPKANASPSLAAVGRLGSGKSFFLKRLCWDTIARGGQVVTIDRTQSGEYVKFASAVSARTQIVRLEAGADVRLDPMRSFAGGERIAVTLGFLSLLAGCSAHTEEGAALAEAVDAVAERPDSGLADVVDELARMGADQRHPDVAARGLARRLMHYRRSPVGQIAFGTGRPMSLDADFIVFWAPHLALPDRETLARGSSHMLLPEQVLGQALLYLVAAVGRRVVFRDPTRFAAALYDEAWALLASPHGQNLLIEGVRDGRKHNGAIWLASQHPNDFAIDELEDLLGARFVFRQARRAIPAALRFLGVTDSVDASVTLEQGLATGVCLYRDVRDRIGLIQVLPPTVPNVDHVFNTAPPVGASGDVDALPGDPDEGDELVPVVAAIPPPAAGAAVAGDGNATGGPVRSSPDAGAVDADGPVSPPEPVVEPVVHDMATVQAEVEVDEGARGEDGDGAEGDVHTPPQGEVGAEHRGEGPESPGAPLGEQPHAAERAREDGRRSAGADGVDVEVLVGAAQPRRSPVDPGSLAAARERARRRRRTPLAQALAEQDGER